MRLLLDAAGALFFAVACCALGCGNPAPAAKTPAPDADKAKPASAPGQQLRPAPPPAAAVDSPDASPTGQPPAASSPSRAALPPREKTLEDLAARAAAEEFKLPPIEESKVAAAGIRRLTGRHLILYTDLAPSRKTDELPAIFDQAVPQWCKYFGLPSEKAADWQVVGCLIDRKERFAGAGLLPANIPDFLHGFQRGSQFWWYPEEGTYFPRHQMLHEGTHAFMARFLGGAGPPWYMEGMAEYLGLHSWRDSKLVLGYQPRSKEEVPFWGRVKLVRDEFAADRGMMLEEIFRYDAHAHLRNEPYGWSWAAVAFLDAHPLTQGAFRELRTKVADRSIGFSQELYQKLQPQWPVIREDWQLFIIHLDYGYDVAREAVVRSPQAELVAPGGGSCTIAADRGWQSSGLRVEEGKKYRVTARGRFVIAREPKVWWCEPGGVTIRYHQGRPLGVLMAAMGDVEGHASAITTLAEPVAIGLASEITAPSTGTLYFRINDHPAELADNEGQLVVEVLPLP